jgi:coatomer subunit epsilon
VSCFRIHFVVPLGQHFVVEMVNSEDLFELRNYFYLGNYSAAINEGVTVSVDDQGAVIERDVILQRINIAQGKYDEVINSITESSHVALQAVKLLAVMLKDPATKDTVLATVTVWLEDNVATASDALVLICAIIYAHAGDNDSALRTVSRVSALENYAVKVQVLLRMDRADVAEKELARMRRIEEDATLTQLASAWVHLAKGGPSAQEALYIYQDLLERHGATDPILNGMALCYLATGKYDDADRVLREALNKNSTYPTTLINVITCAKYKNKPPELVARYMGALKEHAPNSPWLLDTQAKEVEFDTIASQILTTQ